MANMSYCRFENTLGDLRECLDALNNRSIESTREKIKAKALLTMMAEFIYSENILDDEGEVDYDIIDELIEECNVEE